MKSFMPNKKKNILLGVSASAAIYKTCDIVRIFKRRGFEVKVVMSPNACKLISPVLFRSLSAGQVYTEMFSPSQGDLIHISLGRWADIFVIAPCSLSTLSKIACGICDNLLVSTVFALPEAVKTVIAPAMNVNMWQNPVCQDNIKKLKSMKNLVVAGPAKGRLASGQQGLGRMLEPEDIVKTALRYLKKG